MTIHPWAEIATDDDRPEGADGDQLAVPTEALVEERRAAAKGSYYQKLLEHDPLTLLEPLINSRGYRIRWGDGRLEAEFQMSTNSPWHYVKLAFGLDCYLWHSVLFTVVGKRTQRPFVPSKCLSCYKTVVRPKNVAGLFAMVELQEQFPFPCKSGTELRSYTSGCWGSYHYGQGLDEGLQQYKYVREAVSDHPKLGPETPVILKRGCTEYERACGPSENWSCTEEQLELERMIENSIAHVRNIQPMPWAQVTHVHRRWLERAFQVGDMSYLEFTGGVPLQRPLTVYHQLADPANIPADVGGGWWEFQGKRYRRARLPAEALRNEMLLQTDKNLPHPLQRLK